nr:MAG TPA: hypothetical protein [Caudoviricetes sp.]
MTISGYLLFLYLLFTLYCDYCLLLITLQI